MNQLHIVCPYCMTINRVSSERLQHAPKCGKCKKALFTGHPLTLSAENFDRHLNRNDIPLVVDFWASWCGPCQTMAPAFAQATAALEPYFRLAKINTEQEQAISAKFGIRSIPTLIVFKQGKELTRQSGAMHAADIIRWLKSLH